MASKYYVRRPFDYAGEELDRGQVFELKGARNDEKLIRLGYLKSVEFNHTVLKECSVCQKKFIDEGARNEHAELRHRDIYHGMTAEEKLAAQEEEIDKRERRLERDAPLYFENTQASRDAGEGAYEVRSQPENRVAASKKAREQTGRVKPAPRPTAGNVRSAGR